MSGSAELDFVHKGVKYMLVQDGDNRSDNCDGCAFVRNPNACDEFLAYCTKNVFVPDPDPVNLVLHRLIS